MLFCTIINFPTLKSCLPLSKKCKKINEKQQYFYRLQYRCNYLHKSSLTKKEILNKRWLITKLSMLNNDRDIKLHSIINKFNSLSQFIINKIIEFKAKMLTKLLASMFNPQT